jgi:hypothetical protein
MGTLDRGFKTWAERTAATLRRELEIGPLAPIDPFRVAAFLGIDVCTPRDIPGLPPDVIDPLLVGDPYGWSAVSLATDGGGLVIYNPRKSKRHHARARALPPGPQAHDDHPLAGLGPRHSVLRREAGRRGQLARLGRSSSARCADCMSTTTDERASHRRNVRRQRAPCRLPHAHHRRRLPAPGPTSRRLRAVITTDLGSSRSAPPRQPHCVSLTGLQLSVARDGHGHLFGTVHFPQDASAPTAHQN